MAIRPVGGVVPVGVGEGPAPTRFGQGEAAVGLGSTSTIVGLHFQSVANAASSFAGTAPIAGKVQLEGVYISVGTGSVREDPHRFQLAIATNVPSSQAGIDAEEQVFPRSSQAVDSRFDLPVFGIVQDLFLPVTTGLVLNGRRIVCRFYCGSTATIDAYVGLILHRVSGGGTAGDPGFLSGEEVIPA